jgi:hypothetical protein
MRLRLSLRGLTTTLTLCYDLLKVGPALQRSKVGIS